MLPSAISPPAAGESLLEHGHRYDLFGLLVSSEIELPELNPSRSAGAPDVVIRRGLVPIQGAADGISFFAEGAQLNIPGVGRYWMAHGRHMIVDGDAAASAKNVRLYLLGSAMAAILHQRALLPLHANAIVIEGKAIGFMGHPGAGKSTMAAWFHDRGHPVLADDVCVVTFDEHGAPVAHPGIPRLRLWQEALTATGRSSGEFEASFDDMEKYNVPIAQQVTAGVPLSHVYLLEKAEGGESDARVDMLPGSEAVQALVANTYRGAYLPLMGETGRHLLACVQLARRVSVFKARRVWGFDRFDEQGAGLEEHALRVIRQQPA